MMNILDAFEPPCEPSQPKTVEDLFPMMGECIAMLNRESVVMEEALRREGWDI